MKIAETLGLNKYKNGFGEKLVCYKNILKCQILLKFVTFCRKVFSQNYKNILTKHGKRYILINIINLQIKSN